MTEKSDILNSYVIPEYEMLHTQSKEYIVDDIINPELFTTLPRMWLKAT